MTGAARRMELPSASRAWCTLAHMDYEDAFPVQTGTVGDRTAEQWAPAVVEDAPAMLPGVLRWGWSSLGLKVGPTRSD
jgi:hypothetical protein